MMKEYVSTCDSLGQRAQQRALVAHLSISLPTQKVICKQFPYSLSSSASKYSLNAIVSLLGNIRPDARKFMPTKWTSISKTWELMGKSSSFISSQWHNHETCLIVSQMVPNVFAAKLPTEVNCLSAHTSLASPVSLSYFSRNYILICV